MDTVSTGTDAEHTGKHRQSEWRDGHTSRSEFIPELLGARLGGTAEVRPPKVARPEVDHEARRLSMARTRGSDLSANLYPQPARPSQLRTQPDSPQVADRMPRYATRKSG